MNLIILPCESCLRYKVATFFTAKERVVVHTALGATEAQMLAVNQLLQGRYLIVGKLGEGGMGTVYEAKDQRLNNTVALKETKLYEDWLLEAFGQEAQLLARLRHPGLPRVIDHFVEGDGRFLVMEFIPGDDLASQVEKRGRAFESDEVLNWGDQLLDALQYLHTRNPPIIHRDVKPQNLKLTEEGKIILLDFGLAKSMLTGTIVYGCSNYYSPPEQKQAAPTDARSDLYSFGATLYYLMTARKPADAQSRSTARSLAEADPLLPVVQVNPNLSRCVSDALMYAMSLDPGDRPSTAGELRRMLNDARDPSQDSQVTSVNDVTPRRIEILLDGRRTRETVRPDFAPAVVEQIRPDREADIKATQVGGLWDNTPGDNSTSSREITLMSRLRSWTARTFVIGVLQLLVAILAIAVSIFIYLNSRSSETKPSDKPPVENSEAGTTERLEPARAEAISYYVELKGGHKTAMASGESLSSDQRFKFHFVPRSSGYLYIVAPGEGNVPMTFLTDRPIPDSGVATNAVEAGAEFQFPKDNWIGLRDDSYQTPFTIIFSPTRLKAPGFFAASAGRSLTVTEQQELDRFLDEHKASRLDVLSEQQANGSAMKLSLPAEQLGQTPLVFRIDLARR